MDKPRAHTTVAHKLARMVYYVLTRGEAFVDGQKNYEEQQRRRNIAALEWRATRAACANLRFCHRLSA